MTEVPSLRPYLIRAVHEWCSENGFAPLINVFVDAHTQVPLEHVKDQHILLNISFDATSGLQLGTDYIHFKSRFSGVIKDIFIPAHNVAGIYARENGQGMSFPVLQAQSDKGSISPFINASTSKSVDEALTTNPSPDTPTPPPSPPVKPAPQTSSKTRAGKPHLRLVK